jgi:N-acetylmuramoyl-L-alanine amidase
MQFETVKILSAAYSLANGIPRFEIKADGPISKVDILTLDKKIVFDVAYTQNNLAQQNYSDNPVVTAIRTSQYATAPMTTRVVLDLKRNDEKCKVFLSEDRKSIVVEFEPKFIDRIELGQNSSGDFINVSGMAPTQIQSFRLSNPDRVVFDLIGTKSAFGWKEEPASGQFVSGLRSDQYTENTTRIVALMDGMANYKITQNGKQTLIQFSAPTISNVRYAVNAANPTIGLITNGISVDESGFRYVDDYQNLTYTIVLPGDFSQAFGSGNLVINDSAITNVEFLQDNAGQTNIVIHQKDYYEYRLEKTSVGYQLKGYKPKELYSKIVIVDPGHGGSDPGAVAGKVQEKALNLSMAMFLKEDFDASNQIKVYYTRTSDLYRSLQYRTDLAKTLGVDLFLSIHNNAMSSYAKGMETLYMPGGTSDTFSSIAIAKIYQKTVVAATGMADRGLKSRDGLYVLRKTEMPAVILELGFMTNPEDLAKLTDLTFQKLIAQSIFNATEKIFNQFPTGR